MPLYVSSSVLSLGRNSVLIELCFYATFLSTYSLKHITRFTCIGPRIAVGILFKISIETENVKLTLFHKTQTAKCRFV